MRSNTYKPNNLNKLRRSVKISKKTLWLAKLLLRKILLTLGNYFVKAEEFISIRKRIRLEIEILVFFQLKETCDCSLSERESAIVRRNLPVCENFKIVFVQSPQTRF